MQTYLQGIMEASQVFTPGHPISQKDCFAGRQEQLTRILEAVVSPGRHPIIYGQRGVGKTSLANIVAESIQNVVSTKISCDATDNFVTIFDQLLSSIYIDVTEGPRWLSPTGTLTKKSLRAVLGNENITPATVSNLLRQVSSWALFILDEFDKLSDTKAKVNIASLIKNVSDNNQTVTFVLVGVGASISELVGHHQSIERNLVQIELPLMTDDEIKIILNRGFNQLGINAPTSVLDEAAFLANGFPHYAHLLGLSSAKVCLKADTKQLTEEVFHLGCRLSVEDSIEKYRDAFAQATVTTQLSRFPMILCACGMARHDERGVFRATDVVEAMKNVFRDEVSIPAVVPALGKFCGNERGQVLEKVPVGKRSHYRFRDPMMRPFLRIKTRTLKKMLPGKAFS